MISMYILYNTYVCTYDFVSELKKPRDVLSFMILIDALHDESTRSMDENI